MNEHVAYVRSALQESTLHEYPTIEFVIRGIAPAGELYIVHAFGMYGQIVSYAEVRILPLNSPVGGHPRWTNMSLAYVSHL